MAIYHFSGKVISRSQGRSSVAAAAYRAAGKIIDHRTELTHDFTKKEHDIIHKEILLPERAPERLKDRKTLWNEVEQTEKRKDAQLCREFNIALPKELTAEQNIKLAREFVQKEFVDDGMIADLCIHKGHSTDGEEQPHIHVMLTQREITPEGFGQKNREWNDKQLLVQWRESWAETANKHLALNGHDIKIDHRSYEEQGINLEPQTKIGPKDAQQYMAKLEEHQLIARENGERIFNDPNIALDAITRGQSTFTHHDIARLVNRNSVDNEQFTKIYEKVKTSQNIIYLGLDDRGRERFTTQEMLNIEKSMLNSAVNLSKQDNNKADVLIAEKILNGYGLTEEQQTAFDHITKNNDIACVVGFAGTGKSYMLGAARRTWEQSGYQPIGMTLSGIAAENLEASSGIESRTVASRFLSWKSGYESLNSKNIVVIDEAAMLDSRQMNKILTETNRMNAKAVLVFDPEQLPAIGAGAPARAISERVGFVEMRDIRRQKHDWQKEATIDFGTNQTTKAILTYEEHNLVQAFNTKDQAMTEMIERWDEVRTNQPDKALLMLAYTKKEVRQLNEQAREAKKQYQELEDPHQIQTELGNREFAEGDRVYFLKNEYKELNVKNGTLGTIEKIQDENRLSVRLDDDEKQEKQKGRVVQFNIKGYNHIDHGYAATVYKAQGTTVDRSFVLASKYYDRHSTYVAMTRHKEGAELFWSKDEFTDFKQMANKISREQTKDITLDYAQVRNLNVPEHLLEKQYKREHLEPNNDQLQQTKERLQEADKRAYNLDMDKLREQKSQQQRAEMQEFKRNFVNKNPELAQQLNRETATIFEKEAWKVEKEFTKMQQDLKQSLLPYRHREKLEKYAFDVSKQSKVMSFVKQHDSDLGKQMEKMAKSFQKNMELEKSQGMSRGFER